MEEVAQQRLGVRQHHPHLLGAERRTLCASLTVSEPQSLLLCSGVTLHGGYLPRGRAQTHLSQGLGMGVSARLPSAAWSGCLGSPL